MIIPEHKHIIVRAEVEKPIKNKTEIKVWITDLVEKLGMQLAIVEQGYNPVVAYIDDEGNRGLTAVAVIKTSHIACHIWDEISPALVQLDVYTCSKLEKEKVLEHIQVMKPVKVDYKVLDREHTTKEVDCGFSYELTEPLPGMFPKIPKNEDEQTIKNREAAKRLQDLGIIDGYKDKPKEDEGTRKGRETAEYLKSLGFMGGKKDKENSE